MGGIRVAHSTIENTLLELKKYKIIPVVRSHSMELGELAIQRLKQAGFKTVEITLTIPNALDLIRKYSREDLIVGAGTVLTLNDVSLCIDAGAQYIVSPTFIEGMPELCKAAGVVCIMSGLTPTEVYYAWKKGSDVVKIFPANSMGGPAYIKSLKAILPEILMIPTGGVTSENISTFLKAGADFIGVGTSLVDLNLIHDEEKFLEHSRKYVGGIANLKLEGLR